MIFLFFLLKKLPLNFLYCFEPILKFFVTYIIRYRKDIINKNLKQVFPTKSHAELKKIKNRFYSSFIQILIESVGAYNMKEKEMRKRVTMDNFDVLKDLFKHNKPILFLFSHCNNWEWLSHNCQIAIGKEVDFYGVYQKLSDEKSGRLMYKIREQYGSKLVESQQFLRHLLKNKNKACVYAVIADQEPSVVGKKHWTKFLGLETSMFIAPLILTEKNKLPVVYGYHTRVKKGYYNVHVEPLSLPPFDLNAVSIHNKYKYFLEKQIHETPECWLWSHNRWKRMRQPHEKLY